VEVPVVPLRPAMFYFDGADGDFEIADVAVPLGLGHKLLHRRNHHVSTERESIGPEAGRPARIIEAHAAQLDERARGCVGDAHFRIIGSEAPVESCASPVLSNALPEQITALSGNFSRYSRIARAV